MQSTLPAPGWGEPRLRRVEEIPGYLGRFFASGRSASGRPIEITEGLWSLLEWCWSLRPHERERSALCRRLILAPELGWREESDIVEAMARSRHPHNPAHLATEEVAGFVAALLADGEATRGRRGRLDVHLEFLLPRLDRHPLFAPEAICAALRACGTPEAEVRAHLAAVHPERLPYTGTWTLSLQDRLQALPVQAGDSDGPGRAIPIAQPQLGRRSRVHLRLRHPPDLAGYFALSVGTGAADAVPMAAPGTVGE